MAKSFSKQLNKDLILLRISAFLLLIFCFLFLSANNAKSQIRTTHKIDLTEPKKKTPQSNSLIIKTFNGEEFNLENQKGHVVMLNFWAHWCSICKQEMKLFNRIHYALPEVKIIGISVDFKNKRQEAQDLAADLNYPNGLVSDISQSSFEIPTAVPTTLILDQNGETQQLLKGGFSEAELKEIIVEVQKKGAKN
jgi:thiol-disulfide isomerase/thioredoxin